MQESRDIARKPRDAAINFDQYRVRRQFVLFDTLVRIMAWPQK